MMLYGTELPIGQSDSAALADPSQLFVHPSIPSLTGHHEMLNSLCLSISTVLQQLKHKVIITKNPEQHHVSLYREDLLYSAKPILSSTPFPKPTLISTPFPISVTSRSGSTLFYTSLLIITLQLIHMYGSPSLWSTPVNHPLKVHKISTVFF